MYEISIDTMIPEDKSTNLRDMYTWLCAFCKLHDLPLFDPSLFRDFILHTAYVKSHLKQNQTLWAFLSSETPPTAWVSQTCINISWDSYLRSWRIKKLEVSSCPGSIVGWLPSPKKHTVDKDEGKVCLIWKSRVGRFDHIRETEKYNIKDPLRLRQVTVGSFLGAES